MLLPRFAALCYRSPTGPLALCRVLPRRGVVRLLLVVLLVAVRLIFRHLDATFPKYLLRTHGPAVPYGLLYAINPALIILLVPIVSAYTQAVPPLKMIKWEMAAEFPSYLDRIRSRDPQYVPAHQLAFNRQDICVAVQRSRSKRR